VAETETLTRRTAPDPPKTEKEEDDCPIKTTSHNFDERLR
jgi:hypothetical protein